MMKTIITEMGYITDTSVLWYRDLNDVLNEIKVGNMPLFDLHGNDSYLDDLVLEMRTQPKERLREYKEKTLPTVAFNGLFGSGMKLLYYNDITAIDIDHIGGREKLESMRQRLIADPHSIAVFETPSGDGLKVIVRHDNTDPALHSQMYRQIMTYYDCHDPKCSDLNRRHFFSYDPNLWINPGEAEPFHFDPTKVFEKKEFDNEKTVVRTPFVTKTGKRKSDKSIIAMLNAGWRKKNPEYWSKGLSTWRIFNCSCLMCKLGVDEELALEYFIDNWSATGIGEEEIIHNCRDGYKYVRDIGEEDTKEWR